MFFDHAFRNTSQKQFIFLIVHMNCQLRESISWIAVSQIYDFCDTRQRIIGKDRFETFDLLRFVIDSLQSYYITISG